MWFSENVQEKLAVRNLMFNFMPAWWVRNCGIEYGKEMVFDPDYRVEAHRAMRRFMAERFGEIRLGDPDPKPCVIPPDWANTFTAALAGCSVEYPADNYPMCRHLPEEKIEGLKVPEDIWSVYPYNEIVRQVKYLDRKLGANVKPVIPTRGVLNEAILLRGAELLGDLYAEPEKAAKLLEYSCDLFKAQMRTNAQSAPMGPVMLFNCTVIMIGPETYENMLFKYDMAIAEEYRRLGGTEFQVHHCGTLDRYSPAYGRLGPVSFLDIGHTSNLRKAMEMFPDSQIQYIVDSKLMNSGTRAQVGDKMRSVLEETRGNWSRLSLNVADIDSGAPDENLFEIYEACKNAAR